MRLVLSRCFLAPLAVALASLAASCGGTPAPPPAPIASPQPPPISAAPPPPVPADPVPTGRLPQDVKPSAYALELWIDPTQERFSGQVDVEVTLEKAKSVVYLHGRDLDVKSATATSGDGRETHGTWAQITPDGVAKVSFDAPLPAGKTHLRLSYEAPFARGLNGLYRVKAGGVDYAFTQFEAIAARQAFPCFDEPVFKTPFDVTLVVPSGDRAIANAPELDRKEENGSVRVHFATTKPLPTYLVAFAVGPLDVVNAPDVPPNAARKTPLPLRGVAAKGRGKDMAYALAHAGEILAKLEGYTGIGYPYEKLDLIAVPDKEGAMENPGAITFREYLLLLDEKTAPVQQKRAYAGVVAHELAHMWFGDLVTMPWWNDIWLNEAFATFMGTRAAQLWDPSTNAEIGLLERVEDAMGTDALASARAIRQPIESTNDIQNAFDSITYQKGGGIIAMFERWLGPDAFQRGIRAYLTSHADGSATADDLLATLSQTSGKDVATPWRTFLDQPGVPFVEASLTCTGKPTVALRQSRYVPLGGRGYAAERWQIPVCVRYGTKNDVKQACTLLNDETGSVALEGACPDWLFPNADAAGYFRFTLAHPDVTKLESKGYAKLLPRERIALADSIRVGFWQGTTDARDVFAELSPLANDALPGVATAPMPFANLAHEWLFSEKERANVEAWGRKVYAPVLKTVGWKATAGEDPERGVLRQKVISFLALDARDPAVRAEAKKLGLAYVKDGTIHTDAVDPDVASVALAVAVQEGDAAFFDSLVAMLEKVDDDLARSRILNALGSTENPELAAKARKLSLDPRVRVSELYSTLWPQMSSMVTREATWEFLKENFDALAKRMSPPRAAGLPFLAEVFCAAPRADEANAFFQTKMSMMEGGPRNVAEVVESIRLCSARRDRHLAGVKAFFGKVR